MLIKLCAMLNGDRRDAKIHAREGQKSAILPGVIRKGSIENGKGLN